MAQHVSSLTDAEVVTLVAKVRAGDVDVFRRLFGIWFPPLVALAYHYVHSTDTANDIVQEVFVEFWNNRERWEWTGSAFGYLQLVVRRRALNVLRHQQVERRHSAAFVAGGVSPASGSLGESSDVALARRELWDAVIAAIQRLPVRMRAVAMLRWIEGIGRSETAEALGVSVRTVDAHLVAAAKMVRRWLEDEGHTPH